jgi:hypothetical protein
VRVALHFGKGGVLCSRAIEQYLIVVDRCEKRGCKSQQEVSLFLNTLFADSVHLGYSARGISIPSLRSHRRWTAEQGGTNLVQREGGNGDKGINRVLC